jgi:hypothetical protein
VIAVLPIDSVIVLVLGPPVALARAARRAWRRHRRRDVAGAAP